jgi:RNA recognition motif-containing protein
MGTRLYVGNLSYEATADSVRAVFSLHGYVSDVHIVTDRDTGRSRGFAFVTMGSAEQASTAVTKMNGALIDGRPLRVNEAQRTMVGPRR